MPVRMRGTPAKVRVYGGDRARAYLQTAGDPETKARKGATALRRVVMPKLRRLVPERTGMLRRSLTIRQRGASVQLRAIRYAPWVRWRLEAASGRRHTVAGTALELLYDNRNRVRSFLRGE